ncbi:MAG: cytochrome d ubiquinol oxidase subunit II, partial [Arenimonas sp.]
MGIDLPLVWAVIILFSIMMYVVMDGFDLGIGMLFPWFQSKEDRDVMMNTVAPVWDGNETWLVLGGAGLMAAFPLAYSIVLSALYLPLALMLVGLIFRGVAFEFRFKTQAKSQWKWDWSFCLGSFAATFAQGLTLGAFIDGVAIRDGRFVGGALDWLAPFPLFCGLGLVIAYMLLG